jgi:hypothetical protein
MKQQFSHIARLVQATPAPPPRLSHISQNALDQGPSRQARPRVGGAFLERLDCLRPPIRRAYWRGGRDLALELSYADDGLENRPRAGCGLFGYCQTCRANLNERPAPGRNCSYGGRSARRFLHYAADSNLKKVVLECGGKNPAVVLKGAENLDHVANHVVNAAFWNMGENCSANSRLIVHKDLKEDLMTRILTRTRDWRIGDPLDPATRVGALIDSEHCAKVSSYLTGEALTGGTVQGNFVAPTIYEVAKDDARAVEEIFGPILSVIEVDSDAEAIALANATEYGLTASVFTANTKDALRAARAIKAGTVTVNCYGEGDISTPFGGYKMSGFGGRDNGMHAHDQYTELKTIWIDLNEPQDGYA